MNILMITGDKNFSVSPRFALQAAQVEKLKLMYMGPGSVWPKVPAGLFDVVTAQDPFWRGLFALSIARRCGARLNIQVHADFLAQGFWKRMLGKFILHRANSVRAVSEKIKKQVENLGVRARVAVLPVFIDVDQFRTLERQPHEKKIILWVGRFEPEKDPTLAITVLEEVRKARVDAKLIMLGAGSMEQQLRQRAKNLPVEFPGWQDPKPYLAQADVVLCTSKHESWGASIVEALAAGLAVVAPDVGLAREAGAIIAPRNGLAETVIKTLHSGARGVLQLKLLSRDEWANQWKNSL